MDCEDEEEGGEVEEEEMTASVAAKRTFLCALWQKCNHNLASSL